MNSLSQSWLIVMRPQLCRLPAGAVSLRTGGSQADEGQDECH